MRLWINAFFFRVASMSPGNSKMVLIVKHNVRPDTDLSHSFYGFVDSTAILTSKAHASEAKSLSAWFFLTENFLRSTLNLSTFPAGDCTLFFFRRQGPRPDT